MIFDDRAHAGREIAARLAGTPDPMVLALPRGGVPVGFEVARALACPLDVVVARKLGAPGQPELGIGAVAEDGAAVLNERLVRMLQVGREQLAEVVAREREEVARRVAHYRGDRPLPPLAGRAVVLVDDGLATGVTAEAAIRTLRARGPARLVLAVPVGAPDTVARLRPQVDELVTVASPSGFGAVGQWYADFDQTTDEQVLRLLEAARRFVRAGPG